MSAISLKSITGITSITTPTGVDNQLTLHNNNTTEAVKLDTAGNLHFHNHLNITGVSTASNFKTGTSNLHNTGLNVQDLDVDGHTNLDNVSVAGVSTFAGNITGSSSLYLTGELNLTGGSAATRYIDAFVGEAGTFALRGTNNADSSGHQVMMEMRRNAGVHLNYSGNTKLQTSSTGVSITGSIAATGEVNIPNWLVHAGDSDTKFGFEGSDTITFETGGYERFRITSGGRFGFNTNNPDSNFRIDCAGSLRLGTGSYGSRLQFSRSGLGDELVIGVDGYGNSTANEATIQSSINSPRPLVFATGNAERLRIDSSGRILKGLTTARGNYGNNTSGVEYGFQIEGTSAILAGLSIIRNSNDANDGGIVLGKTRATSNGGNTVVQAGDDLGNLTFAGNDGSTMLFGAEIFAEVQSGVGNDDMPADLIFKTNGGSTSTTERLRIDSGGDVTVSTGTLYIPQWISHVGDTDSKFGFLQPDIIQFDTAGTTRLKIMNTGQIRIDQGTSANNGIRMRPSGWNYDFRMGAVSSSGGSIWLGQNYEPTGGTRDNASYGTNYLRFTTGGEIMLGTGATDTNPTERLRIASNGFMGVKTPDPQTELNVIGTVSTGRNVARELGTIINISSNHDGSRVGGNVINGVKEYEVGADWLAAGNARVNANLTIELPQAYTCDRFVIYNQNEYNHSNREVKNFTLEGSNDNSSWTTILDDDCGCSHGHEPNPGFSFRLPSGFNDDDEGVTYRYWRFTMKTFHGSDPYGGIMELELYQVHESVYGRSEITTHSLVASDVNTQTLNGVERLVSSEGINILTGAAAADTWEITEQGITTSGSFADRSTIRHKRGVMAVSSVYNTGDLYVRIDNLYNLPGNAWWTFSAMLISAQVQGGLGGHHSLVTSLNFTALSSWSGVSKTDIVGTCNVSVSSHGTNFIELQFDFNDSSRGANTFICSGGTFDPPRISFH